MKFYGKVSAPHKIHVDGMTLHLGPPIDNKSVSLLTGVDNVLPLAEFDFYLAKILKAESALSMDWKEFEMETSVDDELRRSAQFLQGVSRKIPLLNEIDKLRWIKSSAEVCFSFNKWNQYTFSEKYNAQKLQVRL